MSSALNSSPVRQEESLISVIADLVADDRHIAVGAASPIPGAAAILAQMESEKRLDITILHSQKHNRFTEGSRELFDCAARGRVDTFFLGGVQIDGSANINLVGTGQYPNTKRRFPGSFGSALMYYMTKKVILFRLEHSPRTLVEKVDFISAPGMSDKHIHRPGGPSALLTGKALFKFDRNKGRFRLTSIHPGETVDSIIAETGFEFDYAADIPVTSTPSPDRLERIRNHVAPAVTEFYPEFAASVFGSHHPSASIG